MHKKVATLVSSDAYNLGCTCTILAVQLCLFEFGCQVFAVTVRIWLCHLHLSLIVQYLLRSSSKRKPARSPWRFQVRSALLSAERIAGAGAPLVLQNYRFAAEDEAGPPIANRGNP